MKYSILFLVALFSFSAFAQGKYIPQDIPDAIKQLNITLTKKDIRKFKGAGENKLFSFHMSLGMGLRNKWGLWSDSRLAKYFRKNGVNHPDEMSSFIIKSYWLFLNGKPLDVNKRFSKIKYYKNKNSKPKNIPCKNGQHKFSLFHPKITDPESTWIFVAKCKEGFIAYDYHSGWYKPRGLLATRIVELSKNTSLISAPLVSIPKLLRLYNKKASSYMDFNWKTEDEREYLNLKLREIDQLIEMLPLQELKRG